MKFEGVEARFVLILNDNWLDPADVPEEVLGKVQQSSTPTQSEPPFEPWRYSRSTNADHTLH